mmetsp:Transcript_121687/g.351303  ORF Transcript_121687/g.351303 Transcript_121687/m.351303 type:complete len:361 (+) Transcript_121687:80-1162(+)
MVKAAATSKGKAAGGKIMTEVKPLQKQVHKAKEQAVSSAQLAGRKRAAEKRQLSSHKAKASQGVESLGVVCQADGMAFMTSWLSARPYMISWVASLMRNGHLEASFSKQTLTAQGDVAGNVWGKKMVRDFGLKYKSLGWKSAATILAHILGKEDVVSGFFGDGALDSSIAVKALCFMLGVLPSTALPVGHTACLYERPLCCIMKERSTAVGTRIRASVTKETLDDCSDYWILMEKPTRIVSNISGRDVPIDYDLSKADDWVIMNGESYHEGELISERKGFQMKLFRAYELTFERPEFDGHFDCPLEDDWTPDLAEILAAKSAKRMANDAPACSSSIEAAAVARARAEQRALPPGITAPKK